MTTDHQVDGIIEELRAGLREQQTVLTEQQSVLAAQTDRIALLEGQRRAPRAARLTADDVPERRPRRLTRGGMLKAAAMGAIGLAGAEAASTLGAERAFAAASTADSYTANGPGDRGFTALQSSGFPIGGYFVGGEGIYARGVSSDGVHAISDSGHALYGNVGSLKGGGSVILGQAQSGITIASDAAAVRGQIDDTGTDGMGVYGLQGGAGIGVQGETAGAGIGVMGKSAGGTAVQGGTTGTGTGVFGFTTGAGTGVSGFSYGSEGIGVDGGASGTGTGVRGFSFSGHAVSGSVNSLPADGSVILAEVTNGQPIGSNAAAVRGQVGDTINNNGIGVYGSHAGYGWGVYGTSIGGMGVKGVSSANSSTAVSGGYGVSGMSDAGSGVYGVAGASNNPNGGGYGGRFEIQGTGGAQLLLTPFGSGGYPKTGTHATGEIFMDPNGNLFVCVAAGTPGTWKQVAYSGTGPTDARLRHFTIARHGDRVDFHWHVADGKGVAGFELYAAGRRLNRETIRPHRAKVYDASATWKGDGPFALHVVMRDGSVITVRPE